MALLPARFSRTRLIHASKSAWYTRVVLIGRPSKWGNPFKIGRDGSREEVIAKYREWITKGDGEHLLADLDELRGMTMACFCAPAACHGDVLLELLGEKREGVAKAGALVLDADGCLPE